MEVIDTAGQGASLPLSITGNSATVQLIPINIICTYRGVCDFARPMGPVSTLHAQLSFFAKPTHVNYFHFPFHFPREGQGFILVYSIASRSTFERLEVFRQLMLRVKRNRPIFVLVGNKCDKTYEREVSREEGQALARSFGCDFLETSAKTSHNVERLFMNLVRSLRSTRQQDMPVGPPRQERERRQRRCVIM